MPSLTIALLGDPADPWAGPQGGEILGDGQPYRDLPKTVLESELEQPLVDVLWEASRRFDVSWPDGREMSPSWLAFYRPEDDDGYNPRRESTQLQLVDRDGHLIWIPWWQDRSVTVGSVITSAEAGALDGDAYRPYLILRPGYGNGVLPSWAEFILLLWVMRDALGIVADIHGTIQAVKSAADWAGRLLERFRRTPEVVDRHSHHWKENGGSPADLAHLLDRQPWNSHVLAHLLATDQDEAEALLAGRGFVLDEESGLWQPGNGRDDRVIRRLVQGTLWLDWETEYSSQEGRELLKGRIVEIVTEVLAEEANTENG